MSNRRYKGVRVAINRDTTMASILGQQEQMDNRQLEKVDDYVRGLWAADRFLREE